MKVRDVIDKLEKEGWAFVRQKGSHRDFKKEGNPLIVTVSGPGKKEVTPGQLQDIRRKSGLSLR